eukprot:6220564-Pyramimonas_sp.AAC.1
MPHRIDSGSASCDAASLPGNVSYECTRGCPLVCTVMTERSWCRRRRTKTCPPWSAHGAGQDQRDIGQCARKWRA